MARDVTVFLVLSFSILVAVVSGIPLPGNVQAFSRLSGRIKVEGLKPVDKIGKRLIPNENLSSTVATSVLKKVALPSEPVVSTLAMERTVTVSPTPAAAVTVPVSKMSSNTSLTKLALVSTTKKSSTASERAISAAASFKPLTSTLESSVAAGSKISANTETSSLEAKDRTDRTVSITARISPATTSTTKTTATATKSGDGLMIPATDPILLTVQFEATANLMRKLNLLSVVELIGVILAVLCCCKLLIGALILAVMRVRCSAFD